MYAVNDVITNRDWDNDRIEDVRTSEFYREDVDYYKSRREEAYETSSYGDKGWMSPSERAHYNW